MRAATVCVIIQRCPHKPYDADVELSLGAYYLKEVDYPPGKIWSEIPRSPMISDQWAVPAK